MENEKSQVSLGITDSMLVGASNTVVQTVTQMLSDCLVYISKLNVSRDWNYTQLSAKLNTMHAMMSDLSSFIEETTASGSSSNRSKTGSSSTLKPTCQTCCKKKRRKKMLDSINIQLDDFALMPERAHEWDAGLDLKTPEDCHICYMESKVIDTGVHVEIPEGYVGMLKSKSGLMTKHCIVTEGVIDAGFTGTIKVRVFNHHWAECYDFSKGDKITQLVIIPVETPAINVVDKVDGGERGDNGYGSSGK